MFIDVFIPLQILIEMPTPINSIVSIISIITFFCIEIILYQVIWGKNGCWSIEKCNSVSKKIDK
jgi:hypothetical protein